MDIFVYGVLTTPDLRGRLLGAFVAVRFVMSHWPQQSVPMTILGDSGLNMFFSKQGSS